ncbi:MAG: phosphoribosyltransferase domain protein [Myxococcaceae bacterium]|nr:phosphoribosyltransferase domain protein [Myxococcaceae bacterium]
MLQQVLTGLLDLLSPPRCAACATLLDTRAQGFCAGCDLLVEPLLTPAATTGLDGLDDLAACSYGGPLRDALHRFKYEGASELAPALSLWLEQPARALLGRVDCVAVVPLHARKLRQRGYNQSALLARPVARLLGVRFTPSLLRRARDTPAQVGLGRHARQSQLAGAFIVTRKLAGASVLVVDDVRTTGATLDEARRALSEGGARRVYTLALACVPESEAATPERV